MNTPWFSALRYSSSLGCALVCVLIPPLSAAGSSAFAGPAPRGPLAIGVARVDVTPAYPIRLTGYAARQTEAEGAAQPLWAKALAVGAGRRAACVLVTVDNCGVPAGVVEEVARRLRERAGLRRENFAVCSSHTHAGPLVTGFAPNIFAQDIPADQLAAIARYTEELTGRLEQVALEALADRRPGRLAWAQGTVGFAANRRTPGGPVDHALPVLVARDPAGALRAVVANYACHCTTIGAGFNRHCGDWAGFAQAALERDHPGALALITIGCGADANPHPRGGDDFGYALARTHGEALGTAVNALLETPGLALRTLPKTRLERPALPYDPHFTRAQWDERAGQPGIVGYHARRYLERLARGASLPSHLPYVVQTWRFGDDLAMVFLAGEVVVDYARRLKAQYGSDRLWVTAYANDVPCYIPSRRILAEGGYEAETSLWYYDRPQRLAPETEDVIARAVAAQLPRGWQVRPPAN